MSGAPTPAELVALAPYLARDLTELLRGTAAIRDADIARAPDEKPAFADGDLFTSLFEGPTSFEVAGDSASANDTHDVAVHFTNDAEPPAVHWTDHVILIREDGRFVVSDVRYGGDWDFANRGSLVGSLRDALAAR